MRRHDTAESATRKNRQKSAPAGARDSGPNRRNRNRRGRPAVLSLGHPVGRWLHAAGQDQAAETLSRDWDDFTTFYDFPAEHWLHLRTSNPIESVFAGVRLRTNVAKRARVRENALYLVFKIVQRLATHWRTLNGGATLMTLVLAGERFVDGVLVRRPPREEVQAA